MSDPWTPRRYVGRSATVALLPTWGPRAPDRGSRPGAARAPPDPPLVVMTASESLYSVVCTDTAPSVNWQCQVLIHTWKQRGTAR